jgi:hypothetical protein
MFLSVTKSIVACVYRKLNPGRMVTLHVYEGRAVRCYFREYSLFAPTNSLFHPVGKFTANPSWILGLSVRGSANLDEVPCNFPVIREIDCRDAFATVSQHSQPVSGFLALSRLSGNAPEETRNCGSNGLRLAMTCRQRVRLSATMPRRSRFISSGHFRGSH